MSRLMDALVGAGNVTPQVTPDRPNAAKFLQSFVDEAIDSGFVAGLIEYYGLHASTISIRKSGVKGGPKSRRGGK